MDDNHHEIVEPNHNGEENKNQENIPNANSGMAKTVLEVSPIVDNHEEIKGANIETHHIAFLAAERHLPTERVESIKNELSRIDEIEKTETVEMRRELGTLPEDFATTEYSLLADGINPSLLTVEEAEGLYDYTRNATDEIVEQKTELIAGAISRVRNGVRNRRDWFFSPEKAERLDRLTEKYELYEQGEIDTECGFDRAYYLEKEREKSRDYNFRDAYYDRMMAGEEGETSDDYSGEAYSRFMDDMGANGYYGRALRNMSAEELLEENLIEEDDLLVYGPYSHRDLKQDYEIFRASTWVDTVNFRDKSKVSDIIQETILGRDNDTESDLSREYVAREILPKRRPTPKNALSLFSSIGIEFANKTEKELESILSKDEVGKIHDNLSWASYYTSKILGMRSDELKKEYGSTRPVSKEFFEEVLNRSEAITKQQEKWMAKDSAPYLTKLDERMFAVEAMYEPIAFHEEGGDESLEGLALPDDLFAPKPVDQNIVDVEKHGEQ